MLAILSSCAVATLPESWGFVTANITGLGCLNSAVSVERQLPSGGNYGQHAEVWQSYYWDLVTPTAPQYLWIQVGAPVSADVVSVTTHLCSAIGDVDNADHADNQLYRFCGPAATELSYTVLCTDQLLDSTYILCNCTEDIATVPTASTCIDTCTSCQNGYFHYGESTLPPTSGMPSVAPTAAPTLAMLPCNTPLTSAVCAAATTPIDRDAVVCVFNGDNLAAIPAAAPQCTCSAFLGALSNATGANLGCTGTRLRADPAVPPHPAVVPCYSIEDVEPWSVCRTGGSDWCNAGTVWEIQNYVWTPLLWDPGAVAAAVRTAVADLVAAALAAFDAEPNSVCLCDTRRGGWSVHLVDEAPAATPAPTSLPTIAWLTTPAPLTAPAPTGSPTWYQPPRGFYPVDDTTMEYAWMYTLDGPLARIEAGVAVPNPVRSVNVFKPSDAACAAAEGCRVVAPVEIGGETVCPWLCMYLQVTNESMSPVLLPTTTGPNISICPAVYVNAAVLPRFILSMQYNATMVDVEAVQPGTVALWTPWINGTGTGPTCQGDLSQACVPVLEWYASYAAWVATRTVPTQTYLTAIGLEEVLEGQLYPDIELTTAQDDNWIASRFAFFAAYQRAVVSGVCSGRASVTAGNGGVLGVEMTSTQWTSNCSGCGSTLGSHADACATVPLAQCDATPLCLLCGATTTTPAPIPFEIGTLPPTPTVTVTDGKYANLVPVLTVFVGVGLLLAVVLVYIIVRSIPAKTHSASL